MSEKFDIAVIGGGIAGISVAARLSKHAKIGLWEQEDFLAHHSSSRSAAVFISDYGNSDVCELNLITFSELQSKYPNILKQRGLMSLENKGETGKHRQMRNTGTGECKRRRRSPGHEQLTLDWGGIESAWDHLSDI